MTSSLPLIIFDGNCQGQHLASILTASGIAECYAVGQDLGFLPSHLGTPCRYVDEAAALQLVTSARAAGRRAIQASQSTPKSDSQHLPYTPFVDEVIRYPHLQFYSVSPEEAKGRFGPRATPRRVLDMDLSVIEACQKRAKAPVDFATFIRENCANRPLFHTALHPAGELTGMAVASFAQQLPDVTPDQIEQIEFYFARTEGINSSTYHPVPPEVLQELQFDWGEDYELYRNMLVWRNNADWQSLVSSERMLREKFGKDSWCWFSLAQAFRALGRKADAVDAFFRLLEMSPGNIHTWLLGVETFRAFADADGIKLLAHRASCFFQGQRIFDQFMAYLKLNLSDAEAAVPYAWNYHKQTPDRGDGLLPILLALNHLGRRGDMQEIADYELANSSEGRLDELRAVTRGIDGLESLFSRPSGAGDLQ